jgi:hypothetical protein
MRECNFVSPWALAGLSVWLVPELHRMDEVPEREGDDPHRAGEDARATVEGPALAGASSHDTGLPWTFLLPVFSAMASAQNRPVLSSP